MKGMNNMGMMGLNLTKEQLKIGEFYYEFLDETNSYHIFHTESDFSPYSYASEQEAKEKVEKLNKIERLD